MRSISVELSFEIDEHRTTGGEFLIGDGLLELCVAFVHFRGERSSVEFFTRHSKLVDEGKFKVAVPQLAMRIAAAQRKAFRGMSIEFILRSWSRILRRFASRCQDLRTVASSAPDPVSFDAIYYGVVTEVACAVLRVLELQMPPGS